MSLLDSEHVRIIDVPDNKAQNLDTDDFNHLRKIEDVQEETATLSRKEKRLAKKEDKNYKAIFFVISIAAGSMLGRITHIRELAVLGTILGFMFFIDPFYEKVMKKIENW